MKKKGWITGVVVLVVVLLAGVAVAQPPPPFRILHRAGAIYEAGTGWNYQPFNPGILSGDWAVDFLYGPTGPSILHKYGAIWTTDGWDYRGFLAGNDYARALRFLPDLGGEECWCAYMGSWRIWEGDKVVEDPEEYRIHGRHSLSAYPFLYVQITQTGASLVVSHCSWDDDGGVYVCDDVYCMLNGTHIVCQMGEPAAPNDCSWGQELVGQYFWDPVHGGSGEFGIQLALVNSDYFCQGSEVGEERGEFGVITLWRSWYDGETWQDCVCAPGPPGP
jgi:hypothetical protein